MSILTTKCELTWRLPVWMTLLAGVGTLALAGCTTVPLEGVESEATPCGQSWVLQRPEDDGSLAKKRYKIEVSDGRTIYGTSNEKGESVKLWAACGAKVQIILLKD